jgi:hypothetical protein
LHIIRYEDLLSDPFEHLSKLANLLSVSVDKHEIARVIKATSVDKMRMKEQRGMPDHEVSDVLEFIGPAKPKQWLNCLSDEQLGLVDKYMGETMKRHGYL